MQTAWTVLTDTTIKAVLLIARDKNIELDNSEVAATLKEVMKEKIPEIQQEWNDTLPLGDPWLKELLNAQAYTIAIETLKKMEML